MKSSLLQNVLLWGVCPVKKSSLRLCFYGQNVVYPYISNWRDVRVLRAWEMKRMKLLKERILFSVRRRHVCPDITCANFLGKMKIALWPFVKVCSQRQFISILCLRRVKLSLIDEDIFEMIHWVGTKLWSLFKLHYRSSTFRKWDLIVTAKGAKTCKWPWGHAKDVLKST